MTPGDVAKRMSYAEAACVLREHSRMEANTTLSSIQTMFLSIASGMGSKDHQKALQACVDALTDYINGPQPLTKKAIKKPKGKVNMAMFKQFAQTAGAHYGN